MDVGEVLLTYTRYSGNDRLCFAALHQTRYDVTSSGTLLIPVQYYVTVRYCGRYIGLYYS